MWQPAALLLWSRMTRSVTWRAFSATPPHDTNRSWKIHHDPMRSDVTENPESGNTALRSCYTSAGSSSPNHEYSHWSVSAPWSMSTYGGKAPDDASATCTLADTITGECALAPTADSTEGSFWCSQNFWSADVAADQWTPLDCWALSDWQALSDWWVLSNWWAPSDQWVLSNWRVLSDLEGLYTKSPLLMQSLIIRNNYQEKVWQLQL